MTESFIIAETFVNGRMVSRPNRFILEVALEDDKQGVITRAYLPNPGRMRELLGPESVFHVRRDPAPGKATGATVVAVTLNNCARLLHSGMANDMVAWALENQAIPRLANYRILKREFKRGDSRFDFLLQDPASGRKALLEVKSCNLIAGGTASFPDAPSERATRHLRHLQEALIDGQVDEAFALVAVTGPKPDRFIPNLFTDPLFASTWMELCKADQKAIQPIICHFPFSSDLRMIHDGISEIPWDPEFQIRKGLDSGAYMILARLDSDQSITIGALGEIPFKAGYYIYVGSAMRTLGARTARHLSRKKKLKWHADYLFARARALEALILPSSQREECLIAQWAAALADNSVTGFGCSDCDCPSHLFYFSQDPRRNSRFMTGVFERQLGDSPFQGHAK